MPETDRHAAGVAVITLLIAGLAVAWLALVLATPVVPTPIAAAVYALGSLICHQRPERSFHIDAFQLPVCARCLGIYVGAALGAVSRLTPLGPIAHVRRVLILAAAPTAITLVLEWTGLWAADNTIRALSAVPLGAAVALVIVPRATRASRLADVT